MESNVKNVQLDKKDLLVYSLPVSVATGKKGNTKISDIPLKTLQYKKSKVMNHKRLRLVGNGYEVPEYNLYEISEAEDVDGIVRRTVQKKRALANKEGWSLTGNNNATVKYLEMRFLQLSIAQNRPMKLLIKDTVGDTIRFHNAFWKKRRDRHASGGKIRIVKSSGGEKRLDPVAAYFRIAPETMRIKTDKWGNVVKYMQLMPDGRFNEYNPEDVIHFTFNRRAGFNIAAPGMLPLIDDIRALRRIEENVELLIEQHLFPLFTLSIGTDEWPSVLHDDGTSEIDVWTQKIDQMPTNGGLVVSHRHKFEILGYDSELPVEKYLEHFLKRAYTAAGVSALDMGDGSGMNRSTADNASQILISDVKDYQDEFKLQLEFEVIIELLLERYQMKVLSEENIVNFTWAEIDTESLMKLENHNALMYSMNTKTEDQTRLRNGDRIIDSDEERQKLHLYKVEEEQIRMQTEADIKLAKETPQSVTTGSSSTKSSTSSSKAKNTSQNKNTPTNQHGSKSGPTGKKSSLSKEGNKLNLFLYDYDKKGRDLTKFTLTNWIFTLDLSKLHSNFGIRFTNVVDSLVDDTFDLLDNNDYSLQSAKDFLIENISSAFATLESQFETPTA